jgi:hypothetical protein
MMTNVQTAHILEEVLNERRRQIEVKGFTVEHDRQHDEGELAEAAAAYALYAAHIPGAKDFWPWQYHSFRSGTEREALIKAAALLVADIERIDAKDAEA